MDVFVVADFFGIDVEIDGFAYKQDVIHFMFTPRPAVAVAFDVRCAVMQSSKVLEIIDLQL